ncbi:MAG: DNA adenine methylase [Chloroflexota bacterium]
MSAVIAEIGGTAVPSNIAVSADTANHGDAPDGITVATSDASCKFLVGDCLTWLQDNRHLLTPSTFIYADPPYVMRSRASQRDYYRYEYTDDDHIALLELLKSLPCQIMISGYWSQLYEDLLQGWNVSTFTAQTRGGRATEWLWTNYPEPVELHDYRYLGSDFRERERIKRKASRWVKRFKSLPLLERQCIVSQLQAHGVLQPR